MPTYEYRCGKCGYKFSQFQKITEPALSECPRCWGKDCVERLISGGGGLIFKGSGFYITDYKQSTSKNERKEDKKGKKESEKTPGSA